MNEPEAKTLITPATTPSSATSDDNFLLPLCNKCPKTKKSPWYEKYKPPYAILTASLLEILAYSVIHDSRRLRFDPMRQDEVWRFFTYMLIHDSWHHLVLNVVIQCLFAIPLENQQDSFRVGLLYVGSGSLGALGAACVSPDLVIGASAGVYALLISHIADVSLNLKTIKYKITRCISVAIIVASDVVYNLFHHFNKGHPSISWGAHVIGAVSGFLLGLVLYKTIGEKSHSKALLLTGVLLFCSMFITLLIVNFQIRKCTPKNLLQMTHVYLC